MPWSWFTSATGAPAAPDIEMGSNSTASSSSTSCLPRPCVAAWQHFKYACSTSAWIPEMPRPKREKLFGIPLDKNSLSMLAAGALTLGAGQIAWLTGSSTAWLPYLASSAVRAHTGVFGVNLIASTKLSDANSLMLKARDQLDTSLAHFIAYRNHGVGVGQRERERYDKIITSIDNLLTAMIDVEKLNLEKICQDLWSIFTYVGSTLPYLILTAGDTSYNQINGEDQNMDGQGADHTLRDALLFIVHALLAVALVAQIFIRSRERLRETSLYHDKLNKENGGITKIVFETGVGRRADHFESAQAQGASAQISQLLAEVLEGNDPRLLVRQGEDQRDRLTRARNDSTQSASIRQRLTGELERDDASAPRP